MLNPVLLVIQRPYYLALRFGRCGGVSQIWSGNDAA